MARERGEALAANVGELFDYAVDHALGFTSVEAADDLGWSLSKTVQVIHGLRVALADDDKINLTANPPGDGDRWLYSLVGTPIEFEQWWANRLKDSETRIRTILATHQSMVRATSSRTAQGRIVRATVLHLSRLLEDYEEIKVASRLFDEPED